MTNKQREVLIISLMIFIGYGILFLGVYIGVNIK